MKIAILTANIGGIDNIYPVCKQTEKFEYFYYTENTLPFPLPNIDNRMKGKYFKTQAHKFLDHDIFIWVDGSIEVVDGTFVKYCIEQLDDVDIIITRHEERKNIYEELNYIFDKMITGNPYLVSRYAGQPFKKEIEFYDQQKVPLSTPLFNCYFFARWNTKACNEIFDTWWETILHYTSIDQTQFSYACHKHKAKVRTVVNDNLFIRHKHK
jgi:hypothetical protein